MEDNKDLFEELKSGVRYAAEAIGTAGKTVYRTEIIDPCILMINVKQAVIFLQYMRHVGRTVIKPFCRVA